jgi:hypothetical protein
MKIIFKNQDKESFVFELYDEKSKQTLTSSDMIFSTHFFEDNRSKEIFDQALASVAVMIEKDRQQTIQSIELNGNVLIGLIAKKLLPSNVELEKKYLNLQSFFSERDQEWISSRISAVCFHLLQFMNKENLFNGQSKLVSLQEDYKTC